LIGTAEYTQSPRVHKIVATANFPSSYPSIGDRAKGRIPHANIGDAYFALWNAVHLIASQNEAIETLAIEGNYRAFKPIPPDTNVQLDLTLSWNHRTGKIHGKYGASFSLDGEVLLILEGKGIARGL
jgi:hypothetical protein